MRVQTVSEDLYQTERCRIILIAALTIIALTFFYITSTHSRAAEEKDFTYASWATEESVAHNEKALSSYISIGMAQHIDRVIQSKYTAIVQNNSVVANISKSLSVFGALFVFFNCSVIIIKEIGRADLTYESLLKIFLYFTIGCILAANVTAILNLIDIIGVAIKDTISNMITQSGAGQDLGDKIYDAIQEVFGTGVPEDDGIEMVVFLKNFLTNVQLFLLYAMMGISIRLADIAIFSILIEMILRKAFAPIAIAECVRSGMQGGGFEYFKGYLALYIRIAMLYIIVAAYGIILAELVADLSASIVWGYFEIAILNITVFKMFGKTSSIANAVVGGR